MNSIKSKDMQIEIGNSFITVYSPKDEVIFKEPSILLVDKNSRQVIAVGKDAEEKMGKMLGNVEVVKPLKYGFFIDQDMAKEFFTYIIKKTNKNKIFKPSILITRPSNSNKYYDEAFYDICEQAGIRKVKFDDCILFTAKKLGIDIFVDKVNMIVDIGSVMTKIGVIFGGEVIRYSNIKIAGNSFDEAIIRFIKEKHNLIVSRKMAENIKIKIGVVSGEQNIEYIVRARNAETGIPETATINSDEFKDELNKIVINITENIKKLLAELPEESTNDLMQNGIYLTGGGSKVKGLKELMAQELNVKIKAHSD